MVQLAQGGMTAPQGPVINSKSGDAADPKAAQRNATAGTTVADFAALFAALSSETETAAPGAAGQVAPPGSTSAKPTGTALNAARRPNAAPTEIPWVDLPAIAPPVELPVIALAAGLFPSPILPTTPPQDGAVPATDPILMAATMAASAAMPPPVLAMAPDATLPEPAGMAAAGLSTPPQNSTLSAPPAALPQGPVVTGLTPAPAAPQATVASIPLPIQGTEPNPAVTAAAAPVATTPALPSPPPALLTDPMAGGPALVDVTAAPQAAMSAPTGPRPITTDPAGNPPPPLAMAVAQAAPQPLPAGTVIRATSAAPPGIAAAPGRATRDTALAAGTSAGATPVAESRADGLPILTEALVGVASSQRDAPDADTVSLEAHKATAAPSVTPSLAVPQQIVADVAARPHDVVQPMDLAAALASNAAAMATPGAAPPAAAPPTTMAPLPPPLAAEARHQVALRVASAVSSGVDTVSVDLRPPELGRVEVRLTFHEGSVQVVVAAERAATYEAFRQDRAHLEQQLAQAGFDLGGGALDLRHGGLPRERDPEPPKPTGTAAAAPVDGLAEDTTDQPAVERRRLSNSLIDVIA